MILEWLRRRWAEPESRAAAATALGAIAAEVSGKMDLHTMALVLATSLAAFLFPSIPVPTPVIAAVPVPQAAPRPPSEAPRVDTGGIHRWTP